MMNKKGVAVLVVLIICAVVIGISVLAISKLNLTGFAINSKENVVVEIAQVEVWADTSVELVREEKLIDAELLLDDESVLEQDLEFYLDDVLISSDNTQIDLTPYLESPGTYSLSVVFQGDFIQYLNPSSVEQIIEIAEDRSVGVTENVILNETEIEEVIPEFNSTGFVVPEGYVCEEFVENIFWSSGYSLRPQGSTAYHTWIMNTTCESLNHFDCILTDLQIKTRFLYRNSYDETENGQGYVQISEPDESICDNTEQGVYVKYLAYEILKEDESKFDTYCGDDKKDLECDLGISENYGEVSCYGIKTHGSQYSIVDVLEIKYKLCWEDER